MQSDEVEPALLRDLAHHRLVDLSHPLHPDMPFYPAKVPLPFERTQTAFLDRMGVNSGRFAMSEHQGTHLDAPNHFTADGGGIDSIPADHLIGEAVVIDIAPSAATDETYRLTVADIDTWETAHGTVPPDSYVLIHSGWATRWSEPERYNNARDDGLHHPACSPEAAARLVERGVRGVGVDTLSVDNLLVGDDKGAVHKVLHAAGRYVLENLAEVDRLPPRGSVLIIGAIPVVDGTGAPARVLAFVPTSD